MTDREFLTQILPCWKTTIIYDIVGDNVTLAWRHHRRICRITFRLDGRPSTVDRETVHLEVDCHRAPDWVEGDALCQRVLQLETNGKGLFRVLYRPERGVCEVTLPLHGHDNQQTIEDVITQMRLPSSGPDHTRLAPPTRAIPASGRRTKLKLV